MRDVVIVSAVRTPLGSFCGGLSEIPAYELGAIVINEALIRAGLSVNQVDEVIMGNVLQAGQGQNPARQASVKAGLPFEVPAWTLNKVCGSGLKAIISAAQAIMLGDADVIVAGGMESMSKAPHILNDIRKGQRMGSLEFEDTVLRDGLTDAFLNMHMGLTTEAVAEEYKISRMDQDLYAVQSQNRAEEAIKSKRFEPEIVPVMGGKNHDTKITEDEFPRFGTTTEKISGIKPAFKENGTVTAANASGINDGAAAVVLMHLDKALKLGLEPLARIRSWGIAGVDPKMMGIGPIPATQKALRKAGLSIEDIDLVEVNEAFAAQVLTVMRELNLEFEKVNVNGGGIALGHPIGASGARIVVSLLHEMKRRETKIGLATLCIGGGQGISMIMEALN